MSDAENRNSMNIIITNNNINDWSHVYMGRAIEYINRTNRCSFCNGVGHNIRTCTDTRIADFEEECRLSKTFCEWTENPRNTFKEWLMEYYLVVDSQVVKAFAISKCNCRMYSNIDVIVDKIASYIYEDHEEIIDNSSLLEVYELLLSLQNPNSQEESNNINPDTTDTPDTPDKFNIATTIEEIDEQQGAEICECAICYEDDIPTKHRVTLNCKHQFCKDCFKGCLKSTPVYKDLPSCALCRADISTITVHSESVKSDFSDFIVL
jgi:hypothetical protein